MGVGRVVNTDLRQKLHPSPLCTPVLLQLQLQSESRRQTESAMIHQQHSCM